MRLLQRSSVSQPHARKAHGQAWQAAWAGQRRASESREGRAAVLRFRRAFGGVEESTARAFQKTGPGACCLRLLRWLSYLFPLLFNEGSKPTLLGERSHDLRVHVRLGANPRDRG